MKHFVVGMDASDCSNIALRWAANLAAEAHAEIIAVHAYRPPYSESTPDDHDRLVGECKELLDGPWTDPARRMGVTVRAIVEEGDPRDVILAVAEAHDADLIVIGRRGSASGPGLLHAGSIAESFAHHTKSPLAVIPIDASGPTRHVVVGVDGSPESLRSVRWAAQLGDGVQASVVDVVTHGDDERAVDALLDAANEMGADALVVGTRGTGAVTGVRFGGIAIQALHRTELPIILVPPELDSR